MKQSTMNLGTVSSRGSMRKAAWSAFGATLVSIFGAGGCTSSTGENKEVIARPPFVVGKASGTTRFVGTVKELVPAGSYLYVDVAAEDGADRWVATLEKPLRIGATVRVQAYAERTDFNSKRTGRVFSRLLFGQVVELAQASGRK